MVKTDETTELLREIRDLLREQHAMQKARQHLTENDRKTKNLMYMLRMTFNVLIGVFIIGAFYYFYHTVYGTGLL